MSFKGGLSDPIASNMTSRMWCRSSRGEREHCAIDDLFIVHRNFPKQFQTDKRVLGSPPHEREEGMRRREESLRRQRGLHHKRFKNNKHLRTKEIGRIAHS